MPARLGDVLYWSGCVVAGCLALVAFVAARNANDTGIIVGVVFAVSALIAWIVGRACRYVLAGR
jgi:hypothetical protein